MTDSPRLARGRGIDRYAALVRRLLGVPEAVVSLEHGVGEAALGAPPGSFPPVRELAGHARVTLTDVDGRVLGALCAVDDGARVWSEDELAVLRDLAGACSAELRLRLENAALRQRQDRLAALLRRALLDDLPSVPGVELAVARRRSAEGAPGGVWHDAFVAPGGSLYLVLGEIVLGRPAPDGLEAAVAAMRVRQLVQAIAFETGTSPAGILGRADRALAGLRIGALAGVVVARLDRDDRDDRDDPDDPDDHDAGAGHRLSWASAGQPCPLAFVPGTGVVRSEDAPGPFLGHGRPPRHDREIHVAPGSAVVLHTDPLVEASGSERLHELLPQVAGLGAAGFGDRLLARPAPDGDGEDAVALVVRTVGRP